MIKNLEDEFFKFSFEYITNHPRLKHLKLTSNEIIDYRKNIKDLIDSDHYCSSKDNFCMNIDDHYMVDRDENNVLFFKTYFCTKKKEFHALDEEKVNLKIKRVLAGSNITFDSKDAKLCINKVANSFRLSKDMKKIIENIGNPTWERGSHYLKTHLIRETSILFAYASILKNKNVCIVRGQKLKQIIVDFYMCFDKKTSSINREYEVFKNIYHLIIFEFGFEHDTAGIPYMLDYLKDFLQFRHEKQLITTIITNLSWDEIKLNITRLPKFTNEKVAKLKNLEDLFSNVFKNKPEDLDS